MIRIIAVSLALLVGAEAEKDKPGVGWRSDGTGRFPRATPPTEWAKDKNVVWKTALPGPGYGSPVVVGERIFVPAFPASLLSLSVSEGKIQWKQTATVEDALGEKKAKEAADKYAKLDEQRKANERETNKFRKENPDDKDGLKKLRDKRTEIDKAAQELRKTHPRAENRGGAGNTAATPVSDGKHVAAVFGTGVVGVWTVEGKRRWVKFIESPTVGFGLSSSPLISGGKLIVHLNDLVALDLATGKEQWRVALPASHATPLATRLGKEDVLIVPTGAIVRVRDGKVLLKGKWRTSESTPVLHENVFYVADSGSCRAYQLSADEDGIPTVTELWKGETAKGRRTPSSVLHEGLLYAVNTGGILDVIDAKTGKEVYQKRLPMNQVYSSITLAGGFLFVLDTRGKAVVLKPGKKYERVATNDLEGTGACPVFAGDRLYVRTSKDLYCLGVKKTK